MTALQKPIEELLRMGRFPSSKNAELKQVEAIETLLAQVTAPLNNQEAAALATLFGDDDLFGLAWSLVHLVESAPNWPLPGTLEAIQSPWSQTLRDRIRS